MFLLVNNFKMIGMLLNVVHGQVQKSEQRHITKGFLTVPLKLTMLMLDHCHGQLKLASSYSPCSSVAEAPVQFLSLRSSIFLYNPDIKHIFRS